MPDQDDLLGTLTKYFNNPIASEAQRLLKLWDIRAILMGLAWVIDDIQKKTVALYKANPLAPNDQAAAMITARVHMTMEPMMDLVNEAGAKASEWLANIITNATDEDVRALAAYIFSFDRFRNKAFTPQIKKVLERSEGTSCQITLAFALYMCDEKQYLKPFIERGHFLTSSASYEALVQNMTPRMGLANAEEMVVLTLALPQSMGITDRPGLIEVLALDFATDGVAMSDRYGWTRKRY